ncbi:MAG TPA: PspC domain-containing protein [Herpetosiphonaceae bacterium]
MDQRLTRPTDDRMIAGVISGLARYVEMDVTMLRLIVVVLTLIGFGTTIPLYAILWLIVPATGTAQDTRSAVRSNLLEIKSQAESLLNKSGLRANKADWKFDPHTGQPLPQQPAVEQKPRFDPYTGQPIDNA